MLRQVLLKLKVSSRLIKWAIELEEHDIEYCPRKAIKGQALVETSSNEEASATDDDLQIAKKDLTDS